MAHQKAKPRNPQAKPIESYFWHGVEHSLMQKGLPGYSKQDKKDEKRNELIQARLRDEIKGRKLLHVRDFFDIVMQALDEWHKHTMVEEQIQPERVFFEGINSRPLIRFDDLTLDFIFLPAAIRQVRKSTVQMTLPGIGRCRWFAPELAMVAKRGRKPRVEVRFNPYDASVVHCLDPESHALICTAHRWEKIDPHDKNAVSERMRAQNDLIKHIQIITRQFANKPGIKIHQYTPYAAAAAEIKEIEEAREELAVNEAELNRKLIKIGKSLEPAAFAPSILMRKVGG